MTQFYPLEVNNKPIPTQILEQHFEKNLIGCIEIVVAIWWQLLLLTTKTQFLQSEVNFLVLTKINQWFNPFTVGVVQLGNPCSYGYYTMTYLNIWMWHFYSFSMTFNSSFFPLPLPLYSAYHLIDLLQGYKYRNMWQTLKCVWPIYVFIRINFP